MKSACDEKFYEMYNYSSIGKVSKKVERKYLEIIGEHRLNERLKDIICSRRTYVTSRLIITKGF